MNVVVALNELGEQNKYAIGVYTFVSSWPINVYFFIFLTKNSWERFLWCYKHANKIKEQILTRGIYTYLKQIVILHVYIQK